MNSVTPPIAPPTTPVPSAPQGSTDRPAVPTSGTWVRSTTQMLVDDGNLSASQETFKSHKDPNKLRLVGNILTLETGDAGDKIHISQRPDGQLSVKVNDRTYTFNGNPPSDKGARPPFFELNIKTGGGNDNITLDPNVTATVKIESGDGDDTIKAGGGDTDIFAGRGDDHVSLGSGTSYVEGGEGDDTLIGGTGDAVMYGNNGKDKLYAGAGATTKTSYLDGGDGDDELYAGNGHTVINGGLGDDHLVAHDNTTIYTGKGFDTVWANRTKARIYAQSEDRLVGAGQSDTTVVTPSDAGRKAFSVVGTDSFKQRVEDDLELLRASPSGQKMLEELDKAAERNGAPITIEEDEGNAYKFGSSELQKLSPEEQSAISQDDPRKGGMIDGVPGARADQGKVTYNPAVTMTPAGTVSPIVQFYHELSHAWNGANGTTLDGTTDGQANAELQAVGLPTDAPPFDFDNDPSTPPTSTNPSPLTENALRTEMGRPLRTSYL